MRNPTVELPEEPVEQYQLNHTDHRNSGSRFTYIYYGGFNIAVMYTTTSYGDDNNNNTNIELWVYKK